jgi:hypothetical protein
MDYPIINYERLGNKILKIRDVYVMIDRDIAELYGVTTKALNQAVHRNMRRFPDDFMFQLTEKEKQEVVTNCDHLKPLQFSTQLPYVFTRDGVASLSGVLNSDRAIEAYIAIMRAFGNALGLSKPRQSNIEKEVIDIKITLDDHGARLSTNYWAIMYIMQQLGVSGKYKLSSKDAGKWTLRQWLAENCYGCTGIEKRDDEVYANIYYLDSKEKTSFMLKIPQYVSINEEDFKLWVMKGSGGDK